MLTVLGAIIGPISVYAYQQLNDRVLPPVRIENNHAVPVAPSKPSASVNNNARDRRVAAVRTEGTGPIGDYAMASPYVFELEGRAISNPPLPPPNDLIGEIAFRPSVQPQVDQQIVFTLVGQHYQPVQITAMTARVVSRQQPLAGTLVYVRPQGGNPTEMIGFDLDSSQLNARVLSQEPCSNVNVPCHPGPTAQDYLDSRQVTLARDERISFDTSIFTTTCRCQFVLDIAFSDGSTITVDNKGQPWFISGFSPYYKRSYFGDLCTSQYIKCDGIVDCINQDAKRHC
jgi:hypothetical protein